MSSISFKCGLKKNKIQSIFNGITLDLFIDNSAYSMCEQRALHSWINAVLITRGLQCTSSLAEIPVNSLFPF